MAKIYVGNLAYEFEPRDLEEEFARFGKVEQCAVKRGYAFIHFQEPKDAEAAVQEMDNQEWKGRRMRVAFATSTGDGERRPRGDGGRGDGRGGGGGGGGDGQISQNLFVANIPPHIKMRELEEFFEQFGKVENVKILPQARGNQAMSAFVDFTEVPDAKKAHESELVLDGQRLRSDYNIRRGERRRDDFDRDDRRPYSRDYDRYDRRGSFDDSRRSYSSRGHRSDRHDDYYDSRHGSSRRDRSRSPGRRDRSSDRRGSGGGYGGNDDRHSSRRDRSPPRSGGRGERDLDRDDCHQQQQQQRERLPPRSPPRGNGSGSEQHAVDNGNGDDRDGDHSANGATESGSPRRAARNERSLGALQYMMHLFPSSGACIEKQHGGAEGQWHGQSVHDAGADSAALGHETHTHFARHRLLAALGAGASAMREGVIVSCAADGTECAIDDGTGVAVVDMKVFLKNTPQGTGKRPAIGDYIMVIGPLQKKLLQQQMMMTATGGADDTASPSPPLRILAHQIVQLDTKEQREAMWFLEVVEYWTSVVPQA